MKVIAKDRVIYKYRDTGRLLNLTVGQSTSLSKKEIYDMGSLFHRFFVVHPTEDSRVELFTDDPEVLFQQWTERNIS